MYRLQELSCEERMSAIRTGLATVVPIHVLSILNPSDLEIRTCGVPNVDIDFLKVNELRHACEVLQLVFHFFTTRTILARQTQLMT